MSKRIGMLIAAALLLVTMVAAGSMSPALAGVEPPPDFCEKYPDKCPPPPPPPPSPSQSNCNAGNGNGNEGCDPGNSTLNNRGGDETANPLGVNGGSQDNPGGNNV